MSAFSEALGMDDYYQTKRAMQQERARQEIAERKEQERQRLHERIVSRVASAVYCGEVIGRERAERLVEAWRQR